MMLTEEQREKLYEITQHHDVPEEVQGNIVLQYATLDNVFVFCIAYDAVSSSPYRGYFFDPVTKEIRMVHKGKDFKEALKVMLNHLELI